MVHHRSIAVVLAEDPTLGADFDPERMAAATELSQAIALNLPRGEWKEPQWNENARGGAGLLVLGGLLLRYIAVDGGHGSELLGRGDLLHPWRREDMFGPLTTHPRWRVLAPARVAVLGAAFVTRLAAYPEIFARLSERASSRADRLTRALAIVNRSGVQNRLHLTLWQIAERWGKTRGDGVLVPRLTQAVLAELIASRRPTVSSALAQMERDGQITRAREGWLLHGPAPGRPE
jgi:CRP-like cAMP-binding protein